MLLATLLRLPFPHRTIRTLNPDLLVPSDFVVLSDQGPAVRRPTIHVQRQQSDATATLSYRHEKGRRGHLPFPPNARGFLYLHCSPSLPPIAVQIRLRLTPEPNPSLFSTGADLLRDCGSIPWSIDLVRIAKVKNYAPFKALVTSDGLGLDRNLMDSLERGGSHPARFPYAGSTYPHSVICDKSREQFYSHRGLGFDLDLMDSLEHAWEGHTLQGFHTQGLHTLTQPFAINLEHNSIPIGIITTRAQGRIYLTHFYADHRKLSPYSEYPYNGVPLFPQICSMLQGFRLKDTPTGRVLVHFDISPLPEHARPASRPPVLVVRVLKILTPITSVPGYDMHLPAPVEGGLLSKKRKGGNLSTPPVDVPIIFDLEKIKPGLKILNALELLVE
ncbi:hypothetical protein DXG03_006959 [Asterophora parasitica]|uniref:Uncharacterized protein n=1 Tax=Asterophora parasitica TaxID=117018 RepID=A0A9P7G0V5_9AGAR|nr:hypothetical protein DXG03_006959 [Asterophora parasitica]